MSANKISTVRRRLVDAMTSANKKQVDLVKATGLNRGTISRYISGEVEPKSNALYKLAKSLNVSEAWLMGYDVPKERQMNTPQNISDLSESQKALLDLFNRVPEEQQQFVLQIIQFAIKSQPK